MYPVIVYFSFWNRKYMVKTKHASPVANVFKNKKVWIAMGVTLGLLLFFRLGAVIPMPFITINYDAGAENTSFFELMNLLGGGGLSQVSLFAIGVSPYITAQIIVQLLSSDLIPPLSRMAKSGERGKKKLEVITRLITLPFAAIQAYAILALLTTSQQGYIGISASAPDQLQNFSPLFYFFYITMMIAGSYICIFIGDLITKRGVGNGMSLIILSGIVANLFSNFSSVWYSLFAIQNGQTRALTIVISFIVFIFFYIGVLLAVTFINDSVRKIPIQQVGQSLALNNEELSYMPLKINTSGVIPVIFASSIMMIPSIVGQFLPENDGGRAWIENYLSLQSWPGLFLYFALVILFTFFYSYVQINPDRVSTDFKKSGRFIPGVKTGKETEKYLSKVLYRVNWIGGPFLAVVACLPYLVTLIVREATNGLVVIPSSSGLGGTGIVIMVSASLELWQAIKSTGTSSSYSSQRKEIETIIENTSKQDQSVAVSQLW